MHAAILWCVASEAATKTQDMDGKGGGERVHSRRFVDQTRSRIDPIALVKACRTTHHLSTVVKPFSPALIATRAHSGT